MAAVPFSFLPPETRVERRQEEGKEHHLFDYSHYERNAASTEKAIVALMTPADSSATVGRPRPQLPAPDILRASTRREVSTSVLAHIVGSAPS
jgi:hypothetical protein